MNSEARDAASGDSPAMRLKNARGRGTRRNDRPPDTKGGKTSCGHSRQSHARRLRCRSARCRFAAPSARKQLSDVQKPKEPLTLEQQGSFFVGGRPIHVDLTEWEELGPDFAKAFGMPGNAMVDQMYVQFQKAPGSENHVPIVFLHGCCLTSKTWETTPDGRMGWYEYFTRKGFPTYLAEQSGRGRSGFNASGFNEVREGKLPPARAEKDAARDR